MISKRPKGWIAALGLIGGGIALVVVGYALYAIAGHYGHLDERASLLFFGIGGSLVVIHLGLGFARLVRGPLPRLARILAGVLGIGWLVVGLNQFLFLALGSINLVPLVFGSVCTAVAVCGLALYRERR